MTTRTAAHALNESSVAREYFHTLTTILGADPVIEAGIQSYDLNWGVFDPETQDVLGAGETVAEALADALRTVRGWKR